MKHAAFIFISLVALLHASAQTNSASMFQNLEITSHFFEFDSKANTAVYRGNVTVRDPKLQLNCELLTVNLPKSGGKIERIIAETNVVFDIVDEKGEKTHGRSDKAIYTYSASQTATNEIVELTGNPSLETKNGRATGDIIRYDRINEKVTGVNARMSSIAPVTTNAASPIPDAAVISTNSAVTNLQSAGDTNPPATNVPTPSYRKEIW